MYTVGIFHMYLNQFEEVFKVLLIIHCDPIPVISPNTIVLHLVFITVQRKRSGRQRAGLGRG